MQLAETSQQIAQSQEKIFDLTIRNVDEDAVSIHAKAVELSLALDDIKNMFRTELKYTEHEHEETYDVIDCLYDKYFNILKDREVEGLI